MLLMPHRPVRDLRIRNLFVRAGSRPLRTHVPPSADYASHFGNIALRFSRRRARLLEQDRSKSSFWADPGKGRSIVVAAYV